MNDPQLSFERARYVALRERLSAADPDIDERTLADTLDGISDYTDALAAIVRAALKDEARAVGLQLIIDDNLALLKRVEERAQKRRALVRDEMEQAGLHKLAPPDFTASLRSNPPALVVTDESKIPDKYFLKPPPVLQKDLVKAAIKAGEFIDGAELNNPPMGLAVRTR